MGAGLTQLRSCIFLISLLNVSIRHLLFLLSFCFIVLFYFILFHFIWFFFIFVAECGIFILWHVGFSQNLLLQKRCCDLWGLHTWVP